MFFVESKLNWLILILNVGNACIISLKKEMPKHCQLFFDRNAKTSANSHFIFILLLAFILMKKLSFTCIWYLPFGFNSNNLSMKNNQDYIKSVVTLISNVIFDIYSIQHAAVRDCIIKICCYYGKIETAAAGKERVKTFVIATIFME